MMALDKKSGQQNFTKIQKYQPHGGAKGNVRGSTRLLQFILRGTLIFVPHIM